MSDADIGSRHAINMHTPITRSPTRVVAFETDTINGGVTTTASDTPSGAGSPDWLHSRDVSSRWGSQERLRTPLLPKSTVTLAASAALRKETRLYGLAPEYAKFVQRLLSEGGKLVRPYINYDSDGGKGLSVWADLSSVLYVMPQKVRGWIISSWTTLHAFGFCILYLFLRVLLEGGWCFSLKGCWSDWGSLILESLRASRWDTRVVNIIILFCPFLCLCLGPGWDGRARRTLRMGVLVLLVAFVLTLTFQLLMQTSWLAQESIGIVTRTGAMVSAQVSDWLSLTREFVNSVGSSEVAQSGTQKLMTAMTAIKSVPLKDYLSDAGAFAVETVAALNAQLPEVARDFMALSKMLAHNGQRLLEKGTELCKSHGRNLLDRGVENFGEMKKHVTDEVADVWDAARKRGGDLYHSLLQHGSQAPGGGDTAGGGGFRGGDENVPPARGKWSMFGFGNPRANSAAGIVGPARRNRAWYQHVWPMLLKTMNALAWMQKHIAPMELAALSVYGVALGPWLLVWLAQSLWALLFDQRKRHVDQYRHLEFYRFACWADVRRIMTVNRVTQNAVLSEWKELGCVRLKIVPLSSRPLLWCYQWVGSKSFFQAKLRESEIRVYLKFLDAAGEPTANFAAARSVNFRLMRDTGTLAGVALLQGSGTLKGDHSNVQTPLRWIKGVDIQRLTTRIDTHTLSLKKLRDVMLVSHSGSGMVRRLEVVVAQFDQGSRVAGEQVHAGRPEPLIRAMEPRGLLIIVPGTGWWDYQAVVFGQCLVEHGCQRQVMVARSKNAIHSVLTILANSPLGPHVSVSILCVWDGVSQLANALATSGIRVSNIVLLQPVVPGKEDALHTIWDACEQPIGIITGERTISEEELPADLAERPAVWIENDETSAFIVSVSPCIFSLPWQEVIKAVERS